MNKELIKCYIVSKDNYTAHSKTIKQGIEDIKFKILQKNTNVDTLVSEIKINNYITIQDYRLLTGACINGIEQFKKDKEKLKKVKIKKREGLGL